MFWINQLNIKTLIKMWNGFTGRRIRFQEAHA